MNKKVAIMIVPTGIGASIGGYAGDASQTAQKIANHIPLIVNPNIVNAAIFSGITDNMYYVEGWAIEQLVKGNIALLPSKNNQIGIIFDKSIPQDILNVHINTINAVKTVYGIDVVDFEITEESVGVEYFNTDSGISSGTVKNPKTLLKAGKSLLRKGAKVLATVCFFEEPPEDDYEKGIGVDIVGGIEAIISRYLSKELLCLCVHAPAFKDISITTNKVNSKVSAEYITPTFLPCLLFGLKNAPLLKKIEELNEKEKEISITYRDIHSVSVPYNSLGSSTILDSIANNIPVYAIKENSSILNVNKYSLTKQHDILEIESYDEYIKHLPSSCHPELVSGSPCPCDAETSSA